MKKTWNAKKYTTDFSFVHRYGEDLIDLIDPIEQGKVLDLGCGNGALTKRLNERGFSVQGMDSSNSLLNLAQEKYPEIQFILADATNFSLLEPVDIIFSNAVFHWIREENQASMLKCVKNSLKENGQFIFEFGGYGNNQIIHEVLSRSFAAQGYKYSHPFYFPTIGEYSSLLEKVGFKVCYASLYDRPTKLASGEEGLIDWLEMFVKESFSIVNSEDQKDLILEQTVADLRNTLFKGGSWYADYVRLRMKAILYR